MERMRLRLLKMRNWDAVFLDEELPRLDGIRVIERFRAWEKDHRVTRQRNVFLISQSLVPNPSNGSVSATYPEGFDGALGKPILPPNLVQLLASVAESLADFFCFGPYRNEIKVTFLFIYCLVSTLAIVNV